MPGDPAIGWLHDVLAAHTAERVPNSALTGWVTIASIAVPQHDFVVRISGGPGGTGLRSHEADGLLVRALANSLMSHARPEAPHDR